MDTIFISKVEGISEFFYEKLDACFMEGSSNFVTDSIIRDFRICDINKVIEIFVEENHFDSSAFQSDDRFFTTTKIVKTKVYDKEVLDYFIQSELNTSKRREK